MKESVSLLMRRSHTSHQRLGSVSPTDQVRSGQVSGHLNHSSLFTLCCLLFTLTLFTSSYCLPYLVQHRTDWMEGLSLTVGFKHCQDMMPLITLASIMLSFYGTITMNPLPPYIRNRSHSYGGEDTCLFVLRLRWLTEQPYKLSLLQDKGGYIPIDPFYYATAEGSGTTHGSPKKEYVL